MKQILLFALVALVLSGCQTGPSTVTPAPINGQVLGESDQFTLVSTDPKQGATDVDVLIHPSFTFSHKLLASTSTAVRITLGLTLLGGGPFPPFGPVGAEDPVVLVFHDNTLTATPFAIVSNTVLEVDVSGIRDLGNRRAPDSHLSFTTTGL